MGVIGHIEHRAAIRPQEDGTVQPVIVGAEVIAVRMRDPGPAAVRVILVGKRAGDPTHVGAARGEVAEPVIGVGHPFARLAVAGRKAAGREGRSCNRLCRGQRLRVSCPLGQLDIVSPELSLEFLIFIKLQYTKFS
jgi:hypothetical protein